MYSEVVYCGYVLLRIQVIPASRYSLGLYQPWYMCCVHTRVHACSHKCMYAKVHHIYNLASHNNIKRSLCIMMHPTFVSHQYIQKVVTFFLRKCPGYFHNSLFVIAFSLLWLYEPANSYQLRMFTSYKLQKKSKMKWK